MDRLERFLTDYFEGRSCTLFARGSTGLYALFRALRETRGVGEIIIPAICCETVPMAAIYAGMKPVIADVDLDNLCLSYDSVAQKLSPSTVAIVLIYIFGNLFDTAPYQDLQARRDIVLIEDLAQGVGGYDSGQRLGQRFDLTMLSFADTKIVRGKGGAIVERNSRYGDVLRSVNASLPPSPEQHVLQQKQLSLRNLVHALYDLSRTDRSIDISRLFHTMLPHYEDVIVRQQPVSHQARIIQQFRQIADERARRYEKYRYYKDHVENDLFEIVEFPPEAMCWRLPVLVRDPVNAFHLTALLRGNGILASNHYFPLDKLLDDTQNANAADIGFRILNLWVDDLVTIRQVKKTVDLLNAYRPIG